MANTERQEDSAQSTAATSVQRVASLRFLTEPVAGSHVEIHERGVTIGRGVELQQAQVVVADPRMSGLHARIAWQDGEWWLCDLGSRNGGFIDGSPLSSGTSAVLSDNAVIRLGDTLAVFRATPPRGGPEAPVDAFPGVSPLAVEVRRRIHLLAKASGHVLILGETGTGKERVARAVGGTGPFIPQNCAELSRELARSELFGHVRGAFTGTTNNRQGLVELAHEGALFLDEIGEMPLDVQAELLRFLEDGHYRQLGKTELSRSSARVVAATNVDLDSAVRAGSFRRDLLARLRATNQPLELPPLRDRREDIIDWSLRFLREVRPENIPGMPWSVGFMECLLLYSWPENLRELRGVVRGVVEGASAWPIEPTTLPVPIQQHRRALRERSRGDEIDPVPSREHIEAALASAQGSMRTAASALRINRTRLYRLCEKLEIDIDRFRNGG